MTKKAKAPRHIDLIVTIGEADSFAVQSYLLELGAIGLVVEDDETRSIPEKPPVSSGVAHVRATFVDSPEVVKTVEQLVLEWTRENGLSFRDEILWQNVVDEDWVSRFQKGWTAFTVGEGIWIVPSWEKDLFVLPSTEDISLLIDPGMAFGTGQHETTALCARELVRLLKGAPDAGSMKVLDVGTGSGILAMLAAKLGVLSCVGTDIDPDALRVARENLVENQLHACVKLSDDSPSQLGCQFDIVVANILANPLIEMAQEMAACVKSEGMLLLSGVLREQEPRVKQAYVEQGLTALASEYANDWVLLRFVK